MEVLGHIHGALKPLTDQSDIGKRVEGAMQKGVAEYGKVKGRVAQKHKELEDAGLRVKAATPELF